MSVTKVLSHVQDGLLRITLARPEKKNALTQAMYQQLTTLLQQAAEDEHIRAVLLSGNEECFCAGNDIADFIVAQDDSATTALTFLQTLALFPKPLLAAVNGAAVGIGTSMLLHCDLVYASPTAHFELPFCRLGLVPEGGSSLLLPRQLGHRLAFELLVLGTPFNGERAARLGLINGCVADPLAAAEQAAKTLLAMPTQAVRQSKYLLKQAPAAPLAQVLVDEVTCFKQHLLGAEAQQALRRFMEKSK